jgi:uncharacterized damage-inducible protein DinB
MPVPACIAQAAEDYRYNNGFLLRSVEDLSPDEWVKRPSDICNHVAWIVGHIIWARTAVVGRLGGEKWSAPWLGLFARGTKLEEGAAYPSSNTLLDAWKEVGSVLGQALENVSDEAVGCAVTPPGPPSADGKISGQIRFLAWHETYHVGQVSIVRTLLGRKGLMG